MGSTAAEALPPRAIVRPIGSGERPTPTGDAASSNKRYDARNVSPTWVHALRTWSRKPSICSRVSHPAVAAYLDSTMGVSLGNIGQKELPGFIESETVKFGKLVEKSGARAD